RKRRGMGPPLGLIIHCRKINRAILSDTSVLWSARHRFGRGVRGQFRNVKRTTQQRTVEWAFAQPQMTR
ncbi:MAG: hypothetical protein VYD25_11615, partial [Pseudomonadota bacterium]|nr:hypothetical protein [Pseudomonadota bacterium]